MENLQSGIIPIGILVLGILAKFLLEFYFPNSNKKHNLKKNTINVSMSIIVLLLTGNILHYAMTNPWAQELYVNVLFQVFLTFLFLAFLVVANALLVLSANFTELSNDEKERLKDFETA